MDVAVKVMLFQNTAKPWGRKKKKEQEHAPRHVCDRQLVLREAAVCSSVCHPNVVATYHYEVLQASSFHAPPSGLDINDQSGEEAFKLYLIQVTLAAGRQAGKQAGRIVMRQ